MQIEITITLSISWNHYNTFCKFQESQKSHKTPTVDYQNVTITRKNLQTHLPSTEMKVHGCLKQNVTLQFWIKNTCFFKISNMSFLRLFLSLLSFFHSKPLVPKPSFTKKEKEKLEGKVLAWIWVVVKLHLAIIDGRLLSMLCCQHHQVSQALHNSLPNLLLILLDINWMKKNPSPS